MSDKLSKMYDEDKLEELFWEFDKQRKEHPENERNLFKGKLRSYLRHELQRRGLDFPLNYTLLKKQQELSSDEFNTYLSNNFGIEVSNP